MPLHASVKVQISEKQAVAHLITAHKYPFKPLITVWLQFLHGISEVSLSVFIAPRGIGIYKTEFPQSYIRSIQSLQCKPRQALTTDDAQAGLEAVV